MTDKNILIIEDELITSEEIKIKLSQIGHKNISVANTVAEAHKIISEIDVLLILMDIDLKDEIDGIELAAEIKKKHNLPIIYVSSHTDNETLRRLKYTEPYAFISKPVNIEVLKTAIEIAIYKHKIDLELLAEKEKLEIENYKKEKFFSIISHDLRSPVSAIISFSNLLAENFDNYDDHKRKYLLKYLNESSQNLDNLITKIVLWIKTQRKTFKIEKTETSLYEIVETSLKIVKIKAEAKEIKINIDVPKSLNIFADNAHIELVIRELLLNSIKFSRNNTAINIVAKLDNTKTKVVISVEDKGVGMSENLLQKLFKIGQKVQRYGTDDESGTGMSLIVCREYIEKNDGKIWVESTENKGSTFYVSLPVVN